MTFWLSLLTLFCFLFSAASSPAADADRFRYRPERTYYGEDPQTHPSFRRRILRGQWDPRKNHYILKQSNENDLKENLRNLPWKTSEQTILFDNTREMAAIGLSAGGILYLIPEKNIFFWEDQDSQSHRDKNSKHTWLTPVVSNFINDLLIQMHKDIDENDGQVMGSKKAGSFFMFILNPAQSFSQKINQTARRNIFKEGRTQLLTENPYHTRSIGAPIEKIKSNYIGIHFQLTF